MSDEEKEINLELKQLAVNWFNELDADTKHRIIISQYELHMSIRDRQTKEMIETNNQKWASQFQEVKEMSNQEIRDLNREIEKLKMEKDVLSKTSGFDMLKEQLNSSIRNLEKIHANQLLQLENKITGSHNNLENKLIGSHNNLETKLTSNYSKGIMGENWIENTLMSVPNCIVKNVTREKGLTDFTFEIGGMSGLIESKNVEKMSREYNERFKDDVEKAKESEDIDFAIFVAHRLKMINGKPFSLECMHLKKGSVFLFYVADVYNHPDRLLTALNLGQTLVDSVRFANNVEGLMYNINVIMDRISSLQNIMSEQKKNIEIQKTLIKNSQTTINELNHVIKTVIQSSEIKDSKKRLCIDIAKEFLRENKNFTIRDITKRLEDHNISKSNAGTLISRKMGGIKNIRKMAEEELASEQKYETEDVDEAVKKLEENESSESESEIETDSDVDEESDKESDSVTRNEESDVTNSVTRNEEPVEKVEKKKVEKKVINHNSDVEKVEKKEIKPKAEPKKTKRVKKEPTKKKSDKEEENQEKQPPKLLKAARSKRTAKKTSKSTKLTRDALLEETKKLVENTDSEMYLEEMAQKRRSSSNS